MNLDKDFKFSDLADPKVFKQAFGIHPYLILAGLPFITIALIAAMQPGADQCKLIAFEIERLQSEGSPYSEGRLAQLRIEAYDIHCEYWKHFNQSE